MQDFIQHTNRATEGGGVLLGRHLRNGSAIIVDMVTMPMVGDRRSRTRFYRAQRRHQAAIDAAWAESDGTCTYLGEWHTQPESAPTPSHIDCADWHRRLQDDRYTQPICFIIVGKTATNALEGRWQGVIVPIHELHTSRNTRNDISIPAELRTSHCALRNRMYGRSRGPQLILKHTGIEVTLAVPRNALNGLESLFGL